MIETQNVSVVMSSKKLFDEVNIKFTEGNCYGLIGANGAGKSTFLKVLSGEIDTTSGQILVGTNERISVLRQDHFAYEEMTVLETVIMGHERLYAIMKEKEAIYAKADFSEEDGMKAAVLEGEFADLEGWNAEPEAATLLTGIGIEASQHYELMGSLRAGDKVKVLLAQALFGNPDVLLLDEPTNGLDIYAIRWLEEYLINFEKTVIVVSHDRHFLNKVCTHIADVDFGKIKVYVGNYDFWYESSKLARSMQQDSNKKKEEKIKELQEFIARFSANASKSKQATSRKKLLDKITLDDIVPSSRRYPYIAFEQDREVGNDLLRVEGVSKTINDVKVLDNVSFVMNKGDRIALVGKSDIAITTLFKIINGELEADEGTYTWGVTTSRSYLPKDNSEYFAGKNDLKMTEWTAQYAPSEETESFLRSFLGRMLFSGDDVYKKVSVLSGGEKMRLMFTRMMLAKSNILMLDDPTNHLDLESITALNEGLSMFKGSMIFSSHDQQFLETLSNRVVELTPNGIIDRLMSYEDYMNDEGVQEKVAELYALCEASSN